MLFLLKRRWDTALLGCIILVALALLLRVIVSNPLPMQWSLEIVTCGLVVVSLVILSDGLIHSICWFTLGRWYRMRYREFCEVFRGQSLLAMLLGAMMAAVGEELLFRSLSLDLRYLLPSAVVFGLLHHIHRSLWLFTIWSIWQGFLFVIALRWTGELGVTMTAHFAHDLLGFLGIRWLLTYQYFARSIA